MARNTLNVSEAWRRLGVKGPEASLPTVDVLQPTLGVGDVSRLCPPILAPTCYTGFANAGIGPADLAVLIVRNVGAPGGSWLDWICLQNDPTHPNPAIVRFTWRFFEAEDYPNLVTPLLTTDNVVAGQQVLPDLPTTTEVHNASCLAAAPIINAFGINLTPQFVSLGSSTLDTGFPPLYIAPGRAVVFQSVIQNIDYLATVKVTDVPVGSSDAIEGGTPE